MYFLADAAVYLRSTVAKRLRQARRYEGFSSFLHYSIYFPADAIVYTAVFDESRFLPEKAGKVGTVHLDKGT